MCYDRENDSDVELPARKVDILGGEGGAIMSEARDRKMKRERRFEMQKAEKVLRACRSRRGYELFQEQEKKK
jgi:hypothetical protein